MKPATRAATVARNVVGSAVSPPHINAEVLAGKGLNAARKPSGSVRPVVWWGGVDVMWMVGVLSRMI